MSKRNRVRAGVPTGGQFAAGRRYQPGTSLEPVGSSSRFPLLSTPRGRAAARDHLRQLRADDNHDVDDADLIELTLLGEDIRRRHPEATHLVCTAGPDVTVVSAVNFRSDSALAMGSFHPDRLELDELRGYEPLARLARIAGRPGGIYQSLQTFDLRSGWTVVSLQQLRDLASDPDGGGDAAA